MASVIFCFHLFSLMILALACLVHLAVNQDFSVFVKNIRFYGQYDGVGQFLTVLVSGFSSALLGVSGFESSANFVEEQGHGVYPLTLRNMWWGVSVINITFSVLCVVILPLDKLASVHASDSLAFLANVVGGDYHRLLICIDAFIILAASVLTSYVGVSGLVTRMARRCTISTQRFEMLCITKHT